MLKTICNQRPPLITDLHSLFHNLIKVPVTDLYVNKKTSTFKDHFLAVPSVVFKDNFDWKANDYRTLFFCSSCIYYYNLSIWFFSLKKKKLRNFQAMVWTTWSFLHDLLQESRVDMIKIKYFNGWAS